MGFESLVYDDQIGKASLVGAGMRSHPGVSARFFSALAGAGSVVAPSVMGPSYPSRFRPSAAPQTPSGGVRTATVRETVRGSRSRAGARG